MSPTEIVRSYLKAMEARDLDTARQFLHDDVDMVFPGGHRPDGPESITQGSSSRYRRIGKIIDGYDEGQTDGRTVVYCYGTLHGEWPDGEPFSGIRFVDRFELIEGKISAQWVWNDSGEARLTRATDTTA